MWLLAIAASQLSQGQEDMLHWALSNSDPAKVKSMLETHRRENLTIADVLGQDVVDAFSHTHADFMQEHLGTCAAFLRGQRPAEAALAALADLQFLLHQVDNAMDLVKMQGLPTLTALAFGEHEEVGSAALLAWAYAMQNNVPVQEASAPELPELRALLERCDARCAHAVLAIGALLGTQPERFAGVDEAARWLCTTGLARGGRVTKKSLVVLADVLAQGFAPTGCDWDPLLTLVGAPDLDLAEKAFALHKAGVGPDAVVEAFAQRLAACGEDPYCAELAREL